MQHILNCLMPLGILITKDNEWLVKMETPLLVRVYVGGLGLMVRDRNTQLTQLHIRHINIHTTIPCAFHDTVEHCGLTDPWLSDKVECCILTHSYD